MTNEERKAESIDTAIKDKARKDAAELEERKKVEERKDAENGQKLDKILSHLDSINKRCDALEEAGKFKKLPREDGAEAAMDKDEEVEEEGDPKELKADRRADSYGRAVTDAQRDELSSIQSECERVHSAWGNSAPRPMMNELPHEYGRRTAMQLRGYSKDWKDVDLKPLSPEAINIARKQIYADAYTAASANETYAGSDTLREVRRTDPVTGHRIREFYGNPMSWMQQFTGGRRLAKFRLNNGNGGQNR
jgi:hypothetical protein